MKPLLILIISFIIACVGIWLIYHEWNIELAGRIAMSCMLLATTIGHFIYVKGMSMRIPEAIPFKKMIVYITGLIELAAAIGLLIPSLQHLMAILLIIFFICILPSNIYTAIKHLDYEKANYTGSGLKYLWLRISLQLFFIAWVWFFADR